MIARRRNEKTAKQPWPRAAKMGRRLAPLVQQENMLARFVDKAGTTASGCTHLAHRVGLWRACFTSPLCF